MLTGLARPDEGSIFLSRIDCIKDIKKAAQNRIVTDESNLYDEMNGFDNLAFVHLFMNRKKERKKIKGPLKVLVLLILEKLKAYSKGMKRKLTIAAGIIHQPEILFLDEPTTGIDVESARQIRNNLNNE